jgi:hypothetical protein
LAVVVAPDVQSVGGARLEFSSTPSFVDERVCFAAEHAEV